MPSKYLFLSNEQKKELGSGKYIWENLPTLSESTRECYVSILECSVTITDPTITGIDPGHMMIKMNIPSMNYYSSDNSSPVMKYFTFHDDRFYESNLEASVKLLTNDNLKNIEIQLMDDEGDPTPSQIDNVNLTLKIDYVDQQEIAQDYLSQKPRTL